MGIKKTETRSPQKTRSRLKEKCMKKRRKFMEVANKQYRIL